MSLNDRRRMVEAGHPGLSKAAQCELLALHRSGLYYTPIPELEENLAVMRALDEQYLKTPFYGVRRLLVVLACMGYTINVKRVRRLMGVMGWQTLYPTRRTTLADPQKYKYPYLLRELTIDKPNQVWALDITYIPMRRGFLYLFAASHEPHLIQRGDAKPPNGMVYA